MLLSPTITFVDLFVNNKKIMVLLFLCICGGGGGGGEFGDTPHAGVYEPTDGGCSEGGGGGRSPCTGDLLSDIIVGMRVQRVIRTTDIVVFLWNS
jgi:hypothetical protein